MTLKGHDRSVVSCQTYLFLMSRCEWTLDNTAIVATLANLQGTHSDHKVETE